MNQRIAREEEGCIRKRRVIDIACRSCSVGKSVPRKEFRLQIISFSFCCESFYVSESCLEFSTTYTVFSITSSSTRDETPKWSERNKTSLGLRRISLQQQFCFEMSHFHTSFAVVIYPAMWVRELKNLYRSGSFDRERERERERASWRINAWECESRRRLREMFLSTESVHWTWPHPTETVLLFTSLWCGREGKQEICVVVVVSMDLTLETHSWSYERLETEHLLAPSQKEDPYQH
jgi:hypothetical protein